MITLPTLRTLLCLTLMTVGISASHASIEVGASRVIYHEIDNESLLKLKNPDQDRAYLIQSWLEPYKYADNKIANPMQKIPFVITPPLFRIESSDENVIRIIKNGGNLPADRESVFTLNVKAIPETEKSDKNTMMFAIKSSIKLIYRPAALEGGKAESAYQNIKFHIENNKLIATNTTGYAITLSNVTLNNVKVNIKGNTMLEPFASVSYTSPAPKGQRVSWQSIGDLGQLTEMHSITLK